MKCPNCQHKNPDDNRFCRECGSKLSLPCPQCAGEILPSDKFCGKCGHNLTQPSEASPKELSFDEKIRKIQKYLPKGLTDKILSQRDRIEGENKQITVMFADMVGFTPLVNKLGPEEAYSIMDEIYEILIHQVHEYEGTVNEMTGDGIMALFGAPIALEDAPQRALRSALSIHREIAKFNNQKEGIKPIKMRIGVHTGSVVVGTLGNDLRVEFKAVGDTVNLASRMEELAEPSTTFVTQETFKLTEVLFRFEALGEKKIKGKEKPVPVFKLISEKKKVYRRFTSDRMIQSEMVGRDNEMGKMESQILKLKKGQGSITSLIGEAGVGKSRLVAELKNREFIKGVTVLEGQALSMGRNLSFYPIIEIIKSFARIHEDDTESKQLYKLERAIKNIHPREINEILPFIATLMGIKLSGKHYERIKGIEGEALERLIYKNLRVLILKAAEISPIIFIIEDLHWADTSSIELLFSLFRLVQDHRILFINVFRPHYKDTGDKLLDDIKKEYPHLHTEIYLQPLEPVHSELLINNLLKFRGIPDDMTELIKQRSEGNPFFIEEVIRSFIDEGVIEIKKGTFAITEKINSVAIPNTIQELLMSRIDRLEEHTKSLIKTASVIGRKFFHKILIEVAETIEDIEQKIRYLKEVELIREGERLKEVEYLFKHVLAHEIAYGSLLLQKRKKLHLKVAESIGKIFSERLSEFYGMLAYHYSSGEDLDKAEEYMIKAGEEALKSSASSEAINYFQKALELYTQKYGAAVDSEKIARMEKNIASAFLTRGNHIEAIHYYDRALKNLGFKESTHSISLVISLIINLLVLLKNIYLPSKKLKKTPTDLDNKVIDIILNRNKSLVVVDTKRLFLHTVGAIKYLLKFDVSKSQVMFNALSGVSALFYWAGISFKISRRILDYAASFINDENKDISLYWYKHVESCHKIISGDWEKEFDEEVIKHALKIGDIWTAAGYLNFKGRLFIELGDFEFVDGIIKRLEEINSEYNYETAKWHANELTAIMLIKKHTIDDAVRYINSDFIPAERPGQESLKISYLGRKLQIEVMLNDLTSAEKTIAEIENLIQEIGKRTITSIFYLSYAIGATLFHQAKLKNSIILEDKPNIVKYKKAALVCGKTAVKAGNKVPPIRTEANCLMGKYYWLLNKQKKAFKWFEKSVKEGEKFGNRVELPKIYSEVGKRLLEPKSKYRQVRGITAEEYLEKARVMFEEMNLQWDLEQLEQLREEPRQSNSHLVD